MAVHIDAQGFAPLLPDAHTTNFPILSLPTISSESTSNTRPRDVTTDSNSGFALFERTLHQLSAGSSIPFDLLLPPYSKSQILEASSSPVARIGKIATHPNLPVVALSQAHPGGSIFFFDLRTNAYLKYKLALNSNQQLNALAFSKYNLLAAGMSNGDVLIYEVNLGVASSGGSKVPQFSAIPSYASLLPPQFPTSSLIGEITDLDFDYATGRYLAISTTRSGTWIYDTIYTDSLRLSRKPSSCVSFSPSENLLAIAIEKTGDIEFYATIRAGTLSFSLPCISKSGFKSTVTQISWASDGKSLLYCNDNQEGIRILKVEAQSVHTPSIVL
jgi:hypothetical protein